MFKLFPKQFMNRLDLCIISTLMRCPFASCKYIDCVSSEQNPFLAYFIVKILLVVLPGPGVKRRVGMYMQSLPQQQPHPGVPTFYF